MVFIRYSSSNNITKEQPEIINLLDKHKVRQCILFPEYEYNISKLGIKSLVKYFPDIDIMRLLNKFKRIQTSFSSEKINFPHENEKVYDLVKLYPNRISQFYRINLKNPETIAELNQRYNDWNFKGIKIHQSRISDHINSDYTNQISNFCKEKKLPIMVHLSSGKEVRRFIELVKANPGTVYIIAQLIGLEIFEVLKQIPRNIYSEISPISFISEYRLLKALNVFGADRLILGFNSLNEPDIIDSNIEKIKLLPISDSFKELILDENIRSILS